MSHLLNFRVNLLFVLEVMSLNVKCAANGWLFFQRLTDSLENVIWILVLTSVSVVVDTDTWVENGSDRLLSGSISFKEAHSLLAVEKDIVLILHTRSIFVHVNAHFQLQVLVICSRLNLSYNLIVAFFTDFLHSQGFELILVNAIILEEIHVLEPMTLVIVVQILEDALLSDALLDQALRGHIVVL